MDISVDIFADLCVCVCVQEQIQFFLCLIDFENHAVLMKSRTFLCVDDYFHVIAYEFPSSHEKILTDLEEKYNHFHTK